MDSDCKPRMLVIDDDPTVNRRFRRTLGEKYEIQTLEGKSGEILKEARTLARDFWPHLCIVDLRLLSKNTHDEAGLNLVEEFGPERCILYSAFTSDELNRRLTQKYEGQVCIVSKGEPPKALFAEIERMATLNCKCCSKLSIERPPELSAEYIATYLAEEIALKSDMVDDLLCHLYSDEDKIMLESIHQNIVTPRSTARGRSIVFVARPDEFEPEVVKLGPSERLYRESQNYDAWISGKLRGQFYAEIRRHKKFWRLGGITYSLINADVEDIVPFGTHYYQKESAESIMKPLRHFFGKTWKKFYDRPIEISDETEIAASDLFDLYNMAFSSKDIDFLQRLERSQLGRRNKERYFPGIATLLPNPVNWLVRHYDESPSDGVKVALTHGDMHADNLFVSSAHAWAIDFERTGIGHILRDFAELEVDILTRLMPVESDYLINYFRLLVALGKPTRPLTYVESITPELQLAGDIANGESYRKSFEVVIALRKLAREITSYDNEQEYAWALLISSLYAATLSYKSTYEVEIALLLAAVQCARLQNWKGVWPPKEWRSALAS